MGQDKEDKINKALKRIGDGQVYVILRNGEVTKIPPQELKAYTKDGIREVKFVDEEICND